MTAATATQEETRKPGRPFKTNRYRFSRLEGSNIPLEFSYEGFKYAGPTALLDGEVYELPVRVANHLNSLFVPESEYEISEDTGVPTKIRYYKRYRFNCVTVEDED